MLKMMSHLVGLIRWQESKMSPHKERGIALGLQLIRNSLVSDTITSPQVEASTTTCRLPSTSRYQMAV